MELNLDMIRGVFVRQLEVWLESMPAAERSRIIFESADGTEALSAEAIVRNVEQRTPLGEELLANAIGLSAAGVYTGGDSGQDGQPSEAQGRTNAAAAERNFDEEF
jgi:hypothetical protein